MATTDTAAINQPQPWPGGIPHIAVMKVSPRLGLVLLMRVALAWALPAKDGEGQLSVGTPGADTSFLLDSRGGIETFQGSLPTQDLLDAHEKYKDKFEEFRAVAQELPEGVTPLVEDDQFQFAYEVNAKSTGDKKSHIEVRNGDAVNGRYTVVEPDGSLRIVTYRAHPDTGFQASVEKIFNFDEPNDPVLNPSKRRPTSSSASTFVARRAFDSSRRSENRRISSSSSPSPSSDLKTDLVGGSVRSLSQGALNRATAFVKVSDDSSLTAPSFTDQYTSSSTVDERIVETVDVSSEEEKKEKHPKKALRVKQQAYLTILPVVVQSRFLKRSQPVAKASSRP